MRLIFEIKNLQFFKLCLKISTLAVLLLASCVVRRCCFRDAKWDECVDSHAWLTLKIMKILQGVSIFFMLRYLICFYLSLQNLNDSGMISLLQLHPKMHFTYLLTSWSNFVPEKLKGSRLVKKFLAFYGIRKFITAFASTHHLFLSRTTSIQSMPQHPTS